ncbi:uncharacterized protein LOC110927220 [Helianthus annuus]|uniref:uncharacterized protein LOC110927220 n=1 Tax=Helianthus annuus TaxID=4232 RepID=UPI000B8FD9A5|nr:uncharacterized protein LOC110927220 [Helianthus annuus]
MEASKKMPETGSEESRSIIDLTQSDNEDIKKLEKSCIEVHNNEGEATNGEETPWDDETKGHQEVNEVITVGGVVVSDKSEVVSTGEDGGDVMKKDKKRAECSGDKGGVVGGEPPEKKHNFKFRCVGGGDGGGGDGGSDAVGGGDGGGGSDAVDGEPPVQQP